MDDLQQNQTTDPNLGNMPDLNFQPTAPVTGEGYTGVSSEIPIENTPDFVESTAASVEMPVENLVESSKAPESIETLYSTPVPDSPVVDQVKPLPSTPAPQVPPKEAIVDKRTYKEKLTTVKPDADLVTLDADKEEEEFITGVEHAHEHK